MNVFGGGGDRRGMSTDIEKERLIDWKETETEVMNK